MTLLSRTGQKSEQNRSKINNLELFVKMFCGTVKDMSIYFKCLKRTQKFITTDDNTMMMMWAKLLLQIITGVCLFYFPWECQTGGAYRIPKMKHQEVFHSQKSN